MELFGNYSLNMLFDFDLNTPMWTVFGYIENNFQVKLHVICQYHHVQKEKEII